MRKAIHFRAAEPSQEKELRRNTGKRGFPSSDNTCNARNLEPKSKTRNVNVVVGSGEPRGAGPLRASSEKKWGLRDCDGSASG